MVPVLAQANSGFDLNSELGAKGRQLGIRFWMLDTKYSILGVGYWDGSVRLPAFALQRKAKGVGP